MPAGFKVELKLLAREIIQISASIAVINYPLFQLGGI